MVPTPWSRLSISVASVSPTVLMRCSVNAVHLFGYAHFGTDQQIGLHWFWTMRKCPRENLATKNTSSGEVGGSGAWVKQATVKSLSRSNMPSSAPEFTG